MFFFLLLVILLSVGFWVATSLLRYFIAFLSTNFTLSVVALSPADVFLTILKMDLLIVFLVVLPFLVIFSVNYVRPALYPEERIYLKYVPLMYLSSITGAIFGWLISVKVFVPYFLQFSTMIGVVNSWAIINIISFILFNIFAFLLVFNSPFIFTILFSHKIINLQNLGEIRKYVIVLAAIIGAVFSPPDIASQMIIAIPFYLLFEITAQVNILKEKRRLKKTTSPQKTHQ